MSPKQVKITPGCVRDRDAVVDPAHRDHAHRAARPVHQLDVLRQQVVDAVLVDRVRVPAADLHHLVVAARLDRGEDLAGERAAQLGVAELVDELHAAASRRAIAVPGVHQQRVTGRRIDQADLDGAACAASRPRRAPGRAPRRPRTTRIATPSSPHVMQWSSTQEPEGARPSGHAPHSITLAFSSSSSCSYSAPICSSSSRVASASSSSTWEIAKPTWIRTQSPGSDAPRRRSPAGRC